LIYLAAGIACATLLVIILKLFPRFGVDTLHGIVMNYLVCVFFGMALNSKGITEVSAGCSSPWMPLALMLGFLFITIFNLSALTSQRLGIGIASMSMKLALIFPIILGYVLYHESFPLMKVIGVVLAIIAVILSSLPSQKGPSHKAGAWAMALPLIVFIGSGGCDSSVQYAHKTFFEQADSSVFIIMLFLVAFAFGLVYAVFQAIRNKVLPNWRSVVGGIVLGVPNYLSMHFMMKALSKSGYDSSIIFPLANIGVVVSSAFIGILFFKEKQSKINLSGLGLAILAIALIIFSKAF